MGNVAALRILGAIIALLVGLRLLLACLAEYDARRRAAESFKLLRTEQHLRVEQHALALKTRQGELELGRSGYRNFTVERIDRNENQSGSVSSFYLTPRDGKVLPFFQPGQFLTFRLRIPNQPKDVVRCYSLSDAYDPQRYRISVKKVPDGLVSGYLHEEINEGDILDVRKPSGKFFADLADPTPIVLIAGGVGVTPLLSMCNSIIEQQPEREIYFFFANQNGDEVVQREHLEALCQSRANFHLAFCYSLPTERDAALVGSTVGGSVLHRAGYMNLALLQEILPSGAQESYPFYICGPGPMMDAVEGSLATWKVPAENVHLEAFGAKSVAAIKPAAVGAEAAASELQVCFKKSQKTVTWSSESGSLLELAEKNGIVLESGCCVGDCGTCQVPVRSGEVEYLRDPSENPEAGSCLLCIAVPKTDLDLDA
jgi:ferredoxin-NADP reductase